MHKGRSAGERNCGDRQKRFWCFSFPRALDGCCTGDSSCDKRGKGKYHTPLSTCCLLSHSSVIQTSPWSIITIFSYKTICYTVKGPSAVIQLEFTLTVLYIFCYTGTISKAELVRTWRGGDFEVFNSKMKNKPLHRCFFEHGITPETFMWKWSPALLSGR